MHLAGNTQCFNVLQRMLIAQSFHCAISCLPPLFRVLFRPEWMRARNGQLFRLRINHLTLLVEQNNFYARGAKIYPDIHIDRSLKKCPVSLPITGPTDCTVSRYLSNR
ncbi:Uncharacterised protein [Shigella sonnei]|nr:Uncharacterised protein [Shigella sonnei]CSG25420.1 Uncharacterised protein [Shigella sonnei]CSG26326.1 Uncharacterised protein [Shigella sonnei]CSG28858.1 Uncharacterised protein [Shigella sonnei]CSG29153.1 Uncharacterised protein [Shigella sonnei]